MANAIRDLVFAYLPGVNQSAQINGSAPRLTTLWHRAISVVVA
jgi:hypothetical protein